MFQFITGIAKYIIFVFNFIMVIFGLLMILFGILPIVHGGYDSDYSKIAIGLGVVVFLIAFMGCCGAVRENRCLLTGHAVILLVLFLMQIVLAVVVLIAVNNGTLGDKMGNSLYTLFNSPADKDVETFKDIEIWLECCGVKGTTDYGNNALPGSCCGEENDKDADNESTCSVSLAYKTGCEEKLKNYFESNYGWISGLAIGFAVFEVFGAGFTLWTRNHLRRHD